MIDAHGTTLTVDNDAVRIRYSGLAAALRGDDVNGEDIDAGSLAEIAIDSISDVEVQAPTALNPGWVRLHGADATVRFSPNQQVQAQRFTDDVAAARAGESPAAGGVAGLNGVALAIALANPEWDSVCRIQLTRLVDGIADEHRTWHIRREDFEPDTVEFFGVSAEDVAGAPSFAEVLDEVLAFIGEQPVVAHNGYFQLSALRAAALADGLELPEISFGCTLALVRAAEPELDDHGLAAVGKHFGLEAELDDASRTVGVLSALAQRAAHRGSLMEQFHAAEFTLGVASSEPVVPVLWDRTGTGRALQAAGQAPEIAGGAGTDFRDSDAPAEVTEEQIAEESGSGRRRGPAPWQSVATPDEIPEPNEAADPDNPLFGQHVTLTGDFEPFDKGQLWAGIADHGAQVGKNVTKKTTILVVGTWATKTSKEKKAEEYQAKGQEIEIWQTDRLLSVLGLDEEPPF